MALLKWLFGGRQPFRNKASFREAISIEVTPSRYPTVEEIAERLRATAVLREDSIPWAAQIIREEVVGGAGYENTLNALVRAGSEVTAAEKQRIGASSRTRIGSEFLAALNLSDFTAAKDALFIAIQEAVSVAVREYNFQQFREIGVKYVKLLPSCDERDCDEAKRRNGEIFPIDEATLPLKGCDAAYCRCLFTAVVDLSEFAERN